MQESAIRSENPLSVRALITGSVCPMNAAEAGTKGHWVADSEVVKCQQVTEEGEVTRMLRELKEGDPGAMDRLMPVVYSELRRLSDSILRRERPGHTLQPTALVHEAYLRMVRQDQPDYNSRAQFYAIAGRVMRQILVDYARRRATAKRAKGRGVPL